MSAEAIGAIVLLAAIGILAAWAICGSVRDISRDGHGRREYDPDHDPRRPRL